MKLTVRAKIDKHWLEEVIDIKNLRKEIEKYFLSCKKEVRITASNINAKVNNWVHTNIWLDLKSRVLRIVIDKDICLVDSDDEDLYWKFLYNQDEDIIPSAVNHIGWALRSQGLEWKLGINIERGSSVNIKPYGQSPEPIIPHPNTPPICYKGQSTPSLLEVEHWVPRNSYS